MIINISGEIITIDDKYYEMTVNGLKKAKEDTLEILTGNLEDYIPKNIIYSLPSLEAGTKRVSEILHEIIHIIDNVTLENNSMTVSEGMIFGGLNPILRMYCGYKLADMDYRFVMIVDMYRVFNWRLGQ